MNNGPYKVIEVKQIYVFDLDIFLTSTKWQMVVEEQKRDDPLSPDCWVGKIIVIWSSTMIAGSFVFNIQTRYFLCDLKGFPGRGG